MAQLLRRDWGVYARVGMGTAGVVVAYSAASTKGGSLGLGTAVGAGLFATVASIAFDLAEDRGLVYSPLGQGPAVLAGTATGLAAALLMAVQGGIAGIPQAVVGGAVVGLGAGVGTAGADLANDLYRSRMAPAA